MYKIFIFLSLFYLSACNEVETGPIKVKWDRTPCERCGMVLSDRYHAAQIRDDKSKVHLFDDIGGAILWLQDKAWKDNPKTEVWVNDRNNGAWIDAKTASYVTSENTPMSFGLGAQSETIENAMNYQQAVSYILDREKRFNKSGADLKGQMHHEHQH